MSLKIFTNNIEEKALEQINTLMAQPAFSDCKVRIMPDVHAGAGCVIGFTADLGDKIIPNIVGVDIGCGMYTVPLGNIDIDFEKLDDLIRTKIPHGMDVHEDPVGSFFDHEDNSLQRVYCYNHLKSIDWIERSLGTLGGGNHFIEIDKDDENNKYLIIHTGSRNLGKQVAEYWQNVAIESLSGKNEYLRRRMELIDELKADGRERDIAGELKVLKDHFSPSIDCPKELCWLEGENARRYFSDMLYCQRFARINRKYISYLILDGMGWKLPLDGMDEFETIHNYINPADNIIRKGAISARKGEKVLIPINMRDGCIIGIGKGNDDWNQSAPHGAGRIMSRAEAKRSVSMDEFRASMSGIYTTSVRLDTIDESPMAYKPMDEIIRNIEPTIDIVKIIKPIYNFKAGE